MAKIVYGILLMFCLFPAPTCAKINFHKKKKDISGSLSVDHNSLQFNATKINDGEAYLIVTMSNGKYPITVTSVSQTGDDDFAVYYLANEIPIILQPKQTFNLVVVFTPTGIGREKANIKITTDSNITPKINIPLVGYGYILNFDKVSLN